MCISSNYNITLPCKMCNTSIKDTANHIDYKYLQGSNDPWFYISCYNEIFPFGTLANKNFLFMIMVNSSPTTIKNNDVDATNVNSTSLVLKPANLSLYSISSITFLLSKKMSLEML